MSEPTDEMEFRRQIGARLREARERTGMSLRAVGARFEMSHSAIGHWEKGINPIDLSRLYQLAKLYNTPVSSLLVDHIDKAQLGSLVVAALGLEDRQQAASEAPPDGGQIVPLPPPRIDRPTTRRVSSPLSKRSKPDAHTKKTSGR